MALADMLGGSALTPEEKKQMEMMAVLGAISGALKNVGRSTDPNQRFAGVRSMGDSIAGLMQGGQGGLAQIMQGQKIAQMRKDQERQAKMQEALGKVPTTTLTPTSIPDWNVAPTASVPLKPTQGVQYSPEEMNSAAQMMKSQNPQTFKEQFNAVETPRSLAEVLSESASAAMPYDIEHAAKLATAGVGLANASKPKPETLTKELRGFAELNYAGDTNKALTEINQNPDVKKAFQSFITGERKESTMMQFGMLDGRSVPIRQSPNSQKVEYHDLSSGTWKPAPPSLQFVNQMLNPIESAVLGVPYGTTKGQAADMGVSAVAPQKRGELASFDISQNILDDMEKYSKKVNTFPAGPAGMGRLYNAAKNTAGATLQTNPSAKALDSKAGELSNIIRAMGEKGTLAEGDVQRGLKLIPTVGDTKEVAEQKIKDLRELFKRNKGALVSSLTSPIKVNKERSITEMSDEELLKALGGQ